MLARWLLTGLLASSPELFSAVDVETAHTSNVFLDASEEWDLGVHAGAEIGLDLEPYWSIGYAGELSRFTQHDDLDAHAHELYAFLNPTWDDELPTELVVELGLSTLRNDAEYSELDHLRPALSVQLGLEPEPWWRVRMSIDISYRWAYGAPEVSAVDAWVRASGMVNLRSRTTLTAWSRLGARWFTADRAVMADRRDVQLEVGAHLGQGLWTGAGLQVDYVLRRGFGPSGLLLQSLTDAQMNNVGTEFLYSGHVAALGLKQLLGARAHLQAFLRFEWRDYEAWPAYDDALEPIGADRSDLRLSPGIRGAMVVSRGDAAWPRLDLLASYRWLRQRSNSAPFDTHAHLSLLGLQGTW